MASREYYRVETTRCIMTDIYRREEPDGIYCLLYDLDVNHPRICKFLEPERRKQVTIAGYTMELMGCNKDGYSATYLDDMFVKQENE